MPNLVPPRSITPMTPLFDPWTGDVHAYLSYGLLTLIGLHVLGALYHHVVLHDRVLARMVPEQ
jgi:cytochrome b561